MKPEWPEGVIVVDEDRKVGIGEAGYYWCWYKKELNHFPKLMHKSSYCTFFDDIIYQLVKEPTKPKKIDVDLLPTSIVINLPCGAQGLETIIHDRDRIRGNITLMSTKWEFDAIRMPEGNIRFYINDKIMSDDSPNPIWFEKMLNVYRSNTKDGNVTNWVKKIETIKAQVDVDSDKWDELHGKINGYGQTTPYIKTCGDKPCGDCKPRDCKPTEYKGKKIDREKWPHTCSCGAPAYLAGPGYSECSDPDCEA